MSARRTVRIKTEYREEDLMSVLRRLMSNSYTGPITLHCTQGIVRSVVTETELSVSTYLENSEHASSKSEKLLDAVVVSD
ncbi:MAG TPA: hypothetical protein VN976_21975 [Verrucomicrobiae bacterium]|nr:hypothetical protein [Verrucomicrobiae bacterium]